MRLADQGRIKGTVCLYWSHLSANKHYIIVECLAHLATCNYGVFIHKSAKLQVQEAFSYKTA